MRATTGIDHRVRDLAALACAAVRYVVQHECSLTLRQLSSMRNQVTKVVVDWASEPTLRRRGSRTNPKTVRFICFIRALVEH